MKIYKIKSFLKAIYLWSKYIIKYPYLVYTTSKMGLTFGKVIVRPEIFDPAGELVGAVPLYKDNVFYTFLII